MRIILTGGGTAGHVIPNLALIEELKKRAGIEILYVGEKNGVEKNLIEKIGVNFRGIYCGKMRRYFSFQNFIDLFKIPIGVWQARKILKEFNARVVFSKGGYVSFPVCMAANWLKIPVIIHESDLVPGLANKMCMGIAKKILTSFEETKNHLPEVLREKVVFTGNPIRKEIFEGDKEKGYRLTGFNDSKKIILVMGGSSGARQINELVRASLDELTKKYQIIHLTGRGNIDIGAHNKGYKQFEYLNEELKDIYKICDLVVTRGGSNSLFEIAALKKRAVVIPLSTSVSRGDQIDNAKIFMRKFGWGVLAGNISREDFINTINLSINNQLKMPDDSVLNGTATITDIILKQ